MAPGIRVGVVAVGVTILALASGCATKIYVPPAEPLPPPPPIVLREAEETAPAEIYADADPSALTAYGDTLQGHGSWFDDDDYGTVWAPDAGEVGTDFVPYVSAGHWVYGYGDEYVWVSDFSWGWVTFHHGRWVLTAGHGWVWIPGRAYAGAWVVWRIGDDDYGYIGWAPSPPTWIWRAGVAVSVGFEPPVAYVFCRRSEVFSPHVGVRVVRGDTAPMVSRTRPFGPTWSAPGSSGVGVRVQPAPPPPARGVTAPQPPSVPPRRVEPVPRVVPAPQPKPPPIKAPAKPAPKPRISPAPPAPKKVLTPRRWTPRIPPPETPLRPKVQ